MMRHADGEADARDSVIIAVAAAPRPVDQPTAESAMLLPMFVDCIHCPLRRAVAFRPMAPDELQFVREIKSGERHYPPRTDIMIEGDPHTGICTILSGWAFRYKMLQNGSRQIIDVMLPGDLMGLQSTMTGKIRHSAQSLTDVRVCSLDGARFHNIFQIHPALSEALMATLLIEEQRADARLLLLGQQRPTERLGYFLLELRERLQRRGQSVEGGFQLPMSYVHLSNTIGASRSQVAASLRDLRERNWASLTVRQVAFLDTAAMARGCEYTHLPEPTLRTLI